jgi:hypothetical protein
MSRREIQDYANVLDVNLNHLYDLMQFSVMHSFFNNFAALCRLYKVM